MLAYQLGSFLPVELQHSVRPATQLSFKSKFIFYIAFPAKASAPVAEAN